jgi:hypothetical protein
MIETKNLGKAKAFLGALPAVVALCISGDSFLTNGKSLPHKDFFVHFYGCSRMGFQKKNVVEKRQTMTSLL